MGLVTFILAGVGAAFAVLGAPVVVAALGFTSAGIAAGSFASWLMSIMAGANGGGIAAGSLVSLLQSIGAAGLSIAGKALMATVGGFVGGVIRLIFF